MVAGLWRNKLRSFLTMFGIGWGVVSLVLMSSLAEGFRQGQRESMAALGDSIVMVWGGRTEMQAGGQRAGRRIRLRQNDVQAIREQCTLVDVVAGEVKRHNVSVASAFNSGRFLVVGVTPDYLRLRTLPASEGHQVRAVDVEWSHRVCILGAEVRKQLFEDRIDVLDSRVHINGYPYRVIGLMSEKEQNSSYDGRDNDKILIPASGLIRDCPPNRGVAVEGLLDTLIYRPVSLEGWEAAQRQVRRTLGRIHGFDPRDESALGMWDTVQTAEFTDAIFTSMEIFLGAVALITLSLGGVGVANTMLMTVSERTSEIGLKKALGATRLRIMAEFFMEGMVLAMLAGVGGICGVVLFASAVNMLPMPGMFAGLIIDARVGLIASAALGVVAICAAMPPAWRAARLTPIEALRYER